MATTIAGLKKALDAAFAPGANWEEPLKTIRDYALTTRHEAQVIGSALERLVERPDLLFSGKDGSGLPYRLADFFLEVKGKPAARALATDGIPKLFRIYDALYPRREEYEDTIFRMLKTFAMYLWETGTERIICAARDGFHSDSWWWEKVFEPMADPKHPQAAKLFSAFRNDPPPDFIAVALLDQSNDYKLAGGKEPHAFDSPAGVARLESWLIASDPEHYSYACSSAIALAFISLPGRERLTALALDHLDPEVQMKTAWSLLRTGNKRGLPILIEFCRDVHASSAALRFLGELGLEDAVPEECTDPDFRALAEMSEWLQHPCELGRIPDDLEIVDTREIYWPPTADRRQVWLIRYRCLPQKEGEEEDTGIGMVGSTTWCFFDCPEEISLPSGLYGKHCAWEISVQEDRLHPLSLSDGDGLDLLRKHNPELP